MNQIHLINCKNKSVGFVNNHKHYVIGFRHSKIARKVMYDMHPEQKPYLLRDDPQILSDIKTGIELTIDNSATLFIPKFKGSSTHPLNDGGFHLHNINYDDFIVYPITHSVGIVIPYVLIDENTEEFMYRSHVIDPLLVFPPHLNQIDM